MAKNRKRFIATLVGGIVLIGGVAALAVKFAPITYLPSGWKLQPAGEHQKIGDLLAGGESSPDGKWVAFASVGQGVHKVYVVDKATGKLRSSANLGRGWIGLAWSPDSRTLYASGGTQHVIHRLSVSGSGELTPESPIALGEIANNRGWLAGLAVNASHAFVAISASDKLRKIDLATGQTIAEASFPEGATPYQVRRTGGKLFVSLQGAAQIAEVDLATMAVAKILATGAHPNDLLISGERLFVACGNDDVVEIFDIYSGAREERVVTRPWPDAPPGSTPHALTISPDGHTLYVANSDNNAVAVLDIENRGRTYIKGFVPTGAYPSALSVTTSGKLIVGSAKGLGTGPNGQVDKIDPIAPKGYPYIVTLLNGMLSVVDVSSEKDLQEMTKTVLSVSKYKPSMVERPFQAPAPGSSALPSRLGDPSPIKHVLYIIKENRTYDQLFGDLQKNGKPYGNGDPKLTLFGEDTAPNHRKLAMEYALFDNLYASGEVSVDGHHWTNGAYVPDFMQRTWPQQYSGKGAPRLTPELAATPSGRIWDQVRRKGLSYRTYYYHTRDRMSEEWAEARRKGVRDYESVDIFLREFKDFESKGTMPRFMVMALSEDHTRGTSPGAFTPKACVASNDIGIGKIVETISKSPLWEKFAIFIIEDDAQNGPDHVDAHRTVGLAISPYTRGAGLDSTMYTTTSMLRSIELIFGASPMSQFDAAATPMYKAFRARADVTPYVAVRPTTDLMAKNPPASLPPLLARIDFSEPDQLTLAQEIALNQAIWSSVKGKAPYPGAVRRFGFGGPEMEDED